MQRVTKFMKERACIVERQQRRLAGSRLRKIANIENDRPDVAGELLLIAKRGHPGTAVLGRSCEVVADEQCDMTALSVRHAPGASVGMIKSCIDGFE